MNESGREGKDMRKKNNFYKSRFQMMEYWSGIQASKNITLGPKEGIVGGG